MADLTNQLIANTYKDLLQVNAANPNDGLDATVRTIQDGGGTAGPIAMSTAQLNVTGQFALRGTVLTATADELNELVLGSFTHLTANDGTILLTSEGTSVSTATASATAKVNPSLVLTALGATDVSATNIAATNIIVTTVTATGKVHGTTADFTGIVSIGTLDTGGLTYPTSAGSSGQLLQTNGSDTISFTSNGSSLTDLNADNLATGTVPDGRFPATLPAASGVNLTALNATNLGSGTVPDARFPATLPAASGANLTALNASNLGSGTVPDARFPATLPAASGVNLTALNADNLGSGTVPDARFPATLPAASGANLTALDASNLGSGTVPDARFPATLPAASGVNLTALNATNLGSGTVATARLGTGTASSSNFLRGDGSWQVPAAGFTDPMTTEGDIIIRGSSAATRLAIGSNGTFLKSDGTDPEWATIGISDVSGNVDLTSKVTGTLPLANGGTNATTAADARTSLGAAASGANSDITSLTGLTTDLAITHGGTGSSSAADARTALGLAIGSDVAAFNSDTLFADVSDNLTAGFSSDFEAIGNSGTGTQTLEIATAKENLKTMTINGSFTLAPQTVNSVIAFVTTNDGSGGHTITTSGFDLVSGTYNNAASAKHLMRSTVIDGTQVLEILEIA
jgi:hypothetical protein